MIAHRVRPAIVVSTLVLTVILAVAAMWLRALNGPLWPSLLSDWSLGSVLLAISAGAVGTVLAIRIPRNVIGWFFLAEGFLTSVVLTLRQATTLMLSDGAASTTAVWTAWGFAWVIPTNMVLLALLVTLFPFGSPPSRRWRPVVAAVVVLGPASSVVTMLSPYLPDQTLFSQLANPTAVVGPRLGRWLVDLTSIGTLTALLLGVIALTLRTRRSAGTERQQMKWFAFAAIVAVSTFCVGIWVPPLFALATLLAFPALPVAAGVAILRYRLYDIDRLINRTVVYGAVTAVLAIGYLAGVTALRTLTEPLAGDTALAVAASTLAVAALFRPLRSRVQNSVDRRFNRARYDAAATVEALRARLRDEVDLDSLKSELVAVVYATMQPAGTTLWLREAER